MITKIHKTAVIDKDVKIGDNIIVGAYAVINGPCTIGDNCYIASNTVINASPGSAQFDFTGKTQGVVIGNDCVVREMTVIEGGTERPTFIDDNSFISSEVALGHDSSIMKNVTITASASIGGFCWIDERVTIGMGASIHQRSVIGYGAMIGMNATVVRNVEPFIIVKGTPALYAGVNKVGMKRMNFSDEDIENIVQYYSSNERLKSSFDVYFEGYRRAI